MQVKVKVSKPDDYLRPEMNASVAFAGGREAARAAGSSLGEAGGHRALGGAPRWRRLRPAGRQGGAPHRQDGRHQPQGVRVEEGLIGGEDLIVNPPAGLKDGDKVRQKA